MESMEHVNWPRVMKNNSINVEQLGSKSEDTPRGIKSALKVDNQHIIRSLEASKEIAKVWEKVGLSLENVVDWKVDLENLLRKDEDVSQNPMLEGLNSLAAAVRTGFQNVNFQQMLSLIHYFPVLNGNIRNILT
jgi:hypothetical protein